MAMAQPGRKIIQFLFFAVAAAPASAATSIGFQFFLHDDFNTSEPTVTHVAGPSFLDPFAQGALAVFNDLLTLEADRNSEEIGRAHGTYMMTAIAGFAYDFWAFTVLFTSGKHSGSTLSIQGLDQVLVPGRELSIVGGTGTLRYASGYVNMYTILMDLDAGTSTLCLNGTIRLPNELDDDAAGPKYFLI